MTGSSVSQTVTRLWLAWVTWIVSSWAKVRAAFRPAALPAPALDWTRRESGELHTAWAQGTFRVYATELGLFLEARGGTQKHLIPLERETEGVQLAETMAARWPYWRVVESDHADAAG